LGRKNVRNAVYYAILNTLRMGTTFPCVRSRNDPWFQVEMHHAVVFPQQEPQMINGPRLVWEG